MATLALAAAGAAVGSALLPTGITVLGATITGAALGCQVGALAGSFVDQALFGPPGSAHLPGPRLSDLHVTASTEGAPIPRLYGRARLGGQMIWATDIEEEVVRQASGGGGKGGAGAARVHRASSTAISPISPSRCAEGRDHRHRPRLGGRQASSISPSITYRLYPGGEDQLARQPDRGARGRGQRAGLSRHRLRRVRAHAARRFRQPHAAALLRGVPRGRSPSRRRSARVVPHSRLRRVRLRDRARRARVGAGATNASENVHTLQGGTDWTVALDQLQAALPNAARSRSWSPGSAPICAPAHCASARRRVDDKDTEPHRVERRRAHRAPTRISSASTTAAPAYGGTPSDQTVVAAIQDLKARGFGVTLTPFILMDMPAGNALARSLYRRRRRSPPIPGADASPSIRRRASPARPTRRPPPPPGRRRSSARPRRPTSPSSATTRRLFRARRMALAPHGAALRPSRHGRRRRRCLPDRLGAARPDAGPLRRRDLSVRRRAGRRSRPT